MSKKTLILLAGFLILLGLFKYTGDQFTQQTSFHWYSVIPPLLAIYVSLAFKKIFWALGMAVFSGGLLVTVPQNPWSLTAYFEGVIQSGSFVVSSVSDSANLQILAFVVIVLAMISTLIASGGLEGLIQKLSRYAKGHRSSQIITAFLGFLIFVDDYANTMIVGSSMRSVTDSNRVSREKLAFLVDATSAPIAGVAFVSTWIGYEVGLFSQTSKSLGIGMDGYSMFLDAISFRYYCLFMILFVIFNVLWGVDFGPMKKAQQRAKSLGQVEDPSAAPLTSGSFSKLAPFEGVRLNILVAILPIVSLFIFLFAGLWVDGKGIEIMQAQGMFAVFSLSSWREVISQSENNILILTQASGVGLLMAIMCGFFLAKLPLEQIAKSIFSGVKASLLPMTILVLAWSLKGSCDAVGTGKFLSQIASGHFSKEWFPVLVFMLSGLVAFSTGTSWGTMAILIPTMAPLAFELDGGQYGLTLILSFAAVLDGAIFGDHCSPISDTTVLSSIASSCDHLHHVKTQMPYALFVAFLAMGIGYVPAAFGVRSWMSVVIVMGFLLVFYWWLKTKSQKNSQASEHNKSSQLIV